MTAYCEKAHSRNHAVLIRGVLGWISGLAGLRKTAPCSAAATKPVQVPHRDLERLSGISPHLLADIGVVPASATEDTSPWRLQDGRHLLLRPPL
ncbi:hypothetical protein [Leisingera sp. ANG-M7]|uniref:hypothetical protein n=1 Tax=Leisingera sp. ANG-M7 TaxID=1577902 RepID=UPI00057C4861|nr:hypothetical protein [Leisingera sp. ANG-M7]KIC39422.1 hypothetical protein RA26_01895 [Leisingera sp. ANG-M7]